LSLIFEWDENKAEENLQKHNVGFEEAKTVFNDPFSLTVYDRKHSNDEDRYLDIGLSFKRRFIIVSYTEKGKNIRIISSRKANKMEQKDYEKKRKN